MNTTVVNIHNPNFVNCIFGQSHFIKTVEDLHEALISSVPNIQFGLAFCEASGERLIRTSGTNPDLIKLASENAEIIGCGHTFIIFLGNAFPINVLGAIKAVPEVVTVFCATANPLQVVVAETDQGRGVMGVIDGEKPLGIEDEAGIFKRKEFIRKIGYKLS
jgi:uncharacterized protein